MPGVRIHHRDKRDCTVTIPHPGDPHTGRGAKDYEINVDHAGDAIVSETVWRRLTEAFQLLNMPSVFLVLNEVAQPPTLLVDLTRNDPPSIREVR